ncbi:MAG TPA: thioredoxin-like domain-containing protein [Saprospiraceae bacterium]|nr:thioredoxin-like domain-containing protein [Saprospiraceae bacterium]
MKKQINIVLACFAILFTQQLYSQSSRVRTLSFKEFKQEILTASDAIYVLNFWATWCAPCVEELPLLIEYFASTNDPSLRLILVSLDDKNKIQTKLIPFLNKHKISNEVIVLDDSDEPDWINKISYEWTGSLPATLIFYQGRKFLAEKKFTNKDSLTQFIDQIYH